ncbi:M3 family metallopeptidase [Rhizobiales bacterium]|uniref:M3 family metallopeptidase n=1 Tax=Hongsoonwoonella zoysiae TaxID=2821844 RepID=UPI001560F431|nr:M3 family metallopeptidase [Hongsoonwoonella zoysiae]NRG19080.1 M3 family metallopeptidase [Hongsoonwoonella zoysiae]
MTRNANPLLTEWSTPFELPPFGDIDASHFREAFDIALKEARTEIDAIADQPDAPSFENTIVALEKSGKALTKVATVFFNLSGANTSPALQEIEREMAPKLSRHHSQTMLNSALYGRVAKLWESRDDLGLSPEDARVLERYHTSFVRAGAALDEKAKVRMAEISQSLAELGTAFSQNVLADEADYALFLEGEDELAGLPDFLRASAGAAAAERGAEGKFAITLSRSLIEPFLQFSSRRDLREQAFRAWASRGENGNGFDNRKIIAKTLKLRKERANLLGFDNFAEFKLDDTMAKTPAAVRELLEGVWNPAAEAARKEAEALAEIARSEGNNAGIAPWDWRYYAEKLRKAEHDLDEAELKPYLQLENIIQAAFDTARRLFGLNFEEKKGLPVYHPDVRAFEVSDKDGNHVGLFLGDYFNRASKRSGAWMSVYRRQHKLDGEVRPIVVNVMNFAKGGVGEPALLTFDDARTLFHEFGHALHGLLSDVTYPVISGTSVARDFVELPSQLYEHWLSEPEVLSKYAVHYRTGEPMPRELLDRLLAARNFNQGFATVEYLASALYDLDVHSRPEFDGIEVGDLEKETLGRIGMPDEIIMRHRPTHFAHVFSGDGYSSGYYSYMWSEVMDADAFTAFEEKGDIFDPETAGKLKEFIYSAGGKQDPAEAYVSFRGRLPDVGPLLEKRGLKVA